MWIIASIGMFASIFAIILVFVPPAQIDVGSFAFFESFLGIGLAVMIAIPLIIHAFKKPEWKGALNLPS
jgi:hypothetical protein